MRISMALGKGAGLAAALGVLLWSAAGTAGTPPEKKLNGLTDQEAAIHVLNRLAFGPTPGQVDEVRKLGWKAWIEQQLKPEAIDDSALDKQLAELFPSLSMNLEQIYETYQKPFPKKDASPEEKKKFQQQRNQSLAQLRRELQESVLFRAVYSKRQFSEVINEFWRNHFNVDVNKVPFLAMHYEVNAIRPHAFGKFEDLILATAKHPAMLIYLDNFISTAKGLNENYARELMELHTLGVDNFYKQHDVIELAKVLTGWTCGARPKGGKGAVAGKEYGFYFNKGTHAAVPATVVGCKIDGKGGMEDGIKVIRYLANHEGTAKYISGRLCKYLVSDTPSPEFIDRVAGIFRKSGGNLTEVYRAIIFSPEFIAKDSYRAKFKTPFEYTVSALRATGAKIDSGQVVLRDLRMMGQPIYECSVPTGYSDQAEAWLDPGVMVYRWNFAMQLAKGNYKGVQVPASTFERFQKATAAEKAKRVMEIFVPGITDAATEQALARAPDVKTAIGLALGSPGFQKQ